MSFLLSGYSVFAFQEFILPQINDSDYSIVLDRKVFSLSSDIRLDLEVVGGLWSLKGVSGGKLRGSNSIAPGAALRHGDLIQLSQSGVSVSVVVMSFKPALDNLRKYKVKLPLHLTVGKSSDNDIQYNFNSLVSQRHATIDIDKTGCTVTDSSTNGVFIGMKRIRGHQSVAFGDCVNILGLQIVWLGDILAIGSADGNYKCSLEPLPAPTHEIAQTVERSAAAAPFSFFRRSPRSIPKLNTEPIEVESPPQPQRSGKRPLILTIGPSLTMAIPMALGTGLALFSARSSGATASAYMYTGIIIAAASAVIGTVWAVVNLKYAEKTEREAEALRLQKYGEYIAEKETDLSEKYNYNAGCLRELYPSAEECTGYTESSPRLWSRNTTHGDFLYERLGIGQVPFQSNIVIQKKRFTLVDDPLADEPERLLKKYRTLQDVPVGIDLLSDSLIGVVGGGDSARALDIVRLLAVQIAANNCYTDVKMVFLYDGRSKTIRDQWAFARWFPHVWSEDKKTRYVAAEKSEQSEVCFSLTNILRERAEASTQTKRARLKPHYIVFVESFDLLEGEPAARYLLDAGEHLGVTTIILAATADELPNNCVSVIENSPDFSGIYNTEQGDEGKTTLVFDHITPASAEEYARSISGIVVSEPETGGEIPNALTFFDMFHAASLSQLEVLDRWRKNRTYETMRALIGQKAGGADWYLDIHEKYHGPHGLVAGTTGSGKSETLQTYMLSLAVNFSPNDIGFFIIDFKGGGMANLFSNLPHTVGQISNLSGNQVHRAMVSIKSENRRRQRIFGEFGVNHIDNYTRLLKNGEASIPIPHLFIIIDEFAELKREEPDFMRELISVAQVGRSLGVHLILATQKPSGTVDDNIWSNAKFRLCLRVQDKQDSADMLHKPDAAYITQAGRCYMQVGNDEVYELFQSGWSGAEYDESQDVSKTEIASMRSNTGRPAIVGNRMKMKYSEQRREDWLSTVADVTDEAELALGVSSVSELEISSGVGTFLDEVYRLLEERGRDYAPGKTNSAHLMDFARAWDGAKTLSKDKSERLVAAMGSLSAAGKPLPEIKPKTQLTAVVDYLEKVARENGYENKFQLWLPVLPEELYLRELDGFLGKTFDGKSWPLQGESFTLETPIGLYDDPANQSQQPLSIDLAGGGHLAVCGTVVSGKSTFIQSLLYALVMKYTPEQLSIYALDFSSRLLSCFDGLCHVGGIVYEDQSDRIAKFFSMITEMFEQRKKTFSGGNYSQYININGPVCPAVVIAIDNYANFRDKTENKYENILISLSRDGANYGFFLVISSGGFGAAEIQNRMADNIRNVICLEMGDKYKYGDVLRTIHFDVMPEANTKGRGLAYVSGAILEFQTALSLPAEDDYERAEKLSAVFAAMNEAWSGKCARKIPSIPEHPTWKDLCTQEGFADKLAAKEALLPFGYYSRDATVASVELRSTYCYVITGKARTGKTNLLRIMMNSAALLEGSVRYLFDFDGDRLRFAAEENGAKYVNGSAAMFEALAEILEDFKARNIEKRALLASGVDEEEVFVKMREHPPIFLFIDKLSDFVDTAYRPSEGVGNMSSFLENVTEKGFLHNIYIIAGLDTGDMGRVVGQRIYENIVSYKTGIHLGGSTVSQRIFDFSSLPYTEQSTVTKVGIGLLPPSVFEAKVREVIIPDIKG